jgi:nitroimidazol reductase NimA-like FMN-containing flavoprotein (pyridoxamine 5'-phosphate oxidase superfamily)
MSLTQRTEFRRLPVRGSHDVAVIYEILDAAFLAHVGLNADGQPFVIPMLYGRDENHLYLHGSAASRLLQKLETGMAACVTVTLVDGLVLARSAFHHSMNYRSVVAFGTARKIGDPQPKVKALRVISEHLIPGRWKDVRAPSEKELNATSVVEFLIEEASAKVRTGPVQEDEDDYGLQVWAGILPLHQSAGTPRPDLRMAPSIEMPEYIRSYGRRDEDNGSSADVEAGPGSQ